jgi:CubicO group peptidase (beta-lactamase class C family)
MIDQAMSIYLPQNPGSQLSVKRNGEIIFSKAYGMADLERNVTLTLKSKIEAGSVSKQFAAAAILLLEQQGKLSQRDDIRKYLPEMPDYGHVITIEHLIHHTSGLRDWGAVAELTGWPRTTKAYGNEDALEIMKAQQALNNVPGAEFIYSNSNYNLLAILVQRASGKTLAEFTKQHLFIPAGMNDTEWRDNHNRIVRNRAVAYALKKNGYETLMPNENVYGNGGLLTTTEDLLRWNDYYLLGRFGSPSLLGAQTKVTAFNNTAMNDYGAGIYVQKLRGQSLIQHGGATAGYRAFLEIFPDMNLSIAFLSNTSQFDTAKVKLVNRINDIFVPKSRTSGSDGLNTKITVGKPILDTYTGWYRNERDGAGVKVEVKNHVLMMGDTRLIPRSVNKFNVDGVPNRVEFSNAEKLLYINPERDTIHYSKVITPVVNNEYLEAYVGKYFSPEASAVTSVYQDGGKLMFKLKPGKVYELIPTYYNAFQIANFGGNLYFTPGEVQTMKISVPRARNVLFEKMKE